MPNRTERFIQQLKSCEASGDVKALAELFDHKASLKNMGAHQEAQGRSGAEQFWSRYLEAFNDIHSKFTNVIEDEAHAVLEWESDGHLPSGTPVHYSGVSILDFEGDRIKSFRTYYDSAAFVQKH